MSAKTYIPTLVAILHTVCQYIVKYKMTIVKFLPEGGDAALDGIVTACDIFMALVPDNESP
jgi:hypothetical protein